MHIGTLPIKLNFVMILVALGAAAQAAEETTRIPEPAAAVGFDKQTFGPNVRLLKNWYKFNFFGVKPASITVRSNPNGSVTVTGPGGNNYGAQLCTARFVPTTGMWTGTAFGNGAFVEATMSFTGAYHGPGPSFWANDIENMHSRTVANRNIQWLGQSPGFGNWIESDVVEFNASGLAYGIAMHNWYGTPGGFKDVNTATLAGSPVTTPEGTAFSRPHRYGFLWVPATSSAKGYAKWFFDGVQVGNTVTWDDYSQSSKPPPVAGSSAFSVMDNRHLVLILGTGSNPVTISAVSVWQRSAAHNIESGTARAPAK
ncbi:hypothetical protein [Rhodopila sp.]|uniref:hypothetical protein n=1 Tax=Rhodopila sp. TaxID=2480087 RepID=UPI003D1025BE